MRTLRQVAINDELTAFKHGDCAATACLHHSQVCTNIQIAANVDPAAINACTGKWRTVSRRLELSPSASKSSRNCKYFLFYSDKFEARQIDIYLLFLFFFTPSRMEKELCPFGPALRKLRKAQGISLWNLAISIPYRQGNIQRIERGLHEPRIGLAMRILTVLNVSAGEVMEELAHQEGLLQGAIQTKEPENLTAQVSRGEEDLEKVRCPFGPLLRTRRLLHGHSQKLVAEKAAYTLRNLINVEKGSQEPGVMLALRLVVAAGERPKGFFQHLQNMIKDIAI